MRRLPIVVTAALLLVGAGSLAAGEVALAPFVGYSTGPSVGETLTGSFEDQLSGPGYGLIAGFNIGPERWIELMWSHRDVEFCEGCLPEKPGSLDLKIDSIHLAGVYMPGTTSIRPFAVASAGVTLYNPGSGGAGTSAGFSFALGGGVDIFLDDWISLRLDGRGWLAFASGTLYGGCNGGCSIGFSSDGSFELQAFAALVFRIP